jgi:DNA polymerase-3 subunit alpha/error-prone DNA polymerase
VIALLTTLAHQGMEWRYGKIISPLLHEYKKELKVIHELHLAATFNYLGHH